jgi:hypothetical protein
MRNSFRIGAPHVVAPQVEVAELLAYGAPSAKSSGRGGNGCVEKPEAAVLMEARCQFEILEERPVRKPTHSFEDGPLYKLTPIPETEPNPGEVGTPGVKTEKGGRGVELETERAAGGAGLIEDAADQRQSICRQEGVGVQKQKDFSGRVLSPMVHLYGASFRGL